MISRFFAQLVGREEKDDVPEETENGENLLEFDDGDWVIIKIHENQTLVSGEANLLENLLIEHPSMSVYQMREEDPDLGSDEDVDDVAKPVPFRRHVSWRLAAWGSLLPCSALLLSAPRARVQSGEHRKLSRGALHRQNLVKARYSPSDRRYAFFKQPGQRLYNY